jgi:YD repeat-containing protein
MALVLALCLASVPAFAAKQPRALAQATSASDWTYIRDANGNITKTIAPNGRVATTTFDALNRPIKTTYEGAGPGEVSSTTRHHDGNGNLTAVDEVIDGVTRTETRKYDHFDRLEHVTDVHGRTLDYTYDDVGNRTRMVDSDGQETVWTYDGLNRNTSITVPGQGTTTQTFYPSGRPDKTTHPDGTTSTAAYDGAGRLTSLIHAKAGQTLASYVYRYDFNGNRIEQREVNGAGEQVTSYRYDDADRLTQVIEPTRTTVYTLDPVGNRLEELVTDTNGAVISHSNLTYNARDQLTVRDDPIMGAHVDQTFDPNGNLATQQIAATFRTYTYDGQDRLVELNLPNQLPIRFDYDPRGKRIEKSQGGQATRYQYDDQSLTAETNAIGNTLKRYHYSAQQLLSETLAGSTPVNRHFLLDALKTPIAVITQMGAISARTRYDAWGRIPFPGQRGGKHRHSQPRCTDCRFAQYRRTTVRVHGLREGQRIRFVLRQCALLRPGDREVHHGGSRSGQRSHSTESASLSVCVCESDGVGGSGGATV